jgi:hypothetical protein
VNFVTDSILETVKKVLGIEASYNVFDQDILLHTNSVFSDLNQLGIGPDDGFAIEDTNATWSDFLGDDKRKNNVKTYVCLRVRLVFDPPTTSFAIDSMKKQVEELEWRINVYREETDHPYVPPAPIDPDGEWP